MTVANLFRPQFDRRGDPVDSSATTSLGSVVILEGGAAPERLNGRQETASTEGQIGVWTYQESGLDVREGDRLEWSIPSVNDPVRYTVVGQPLWQQAHSFSGTDTLNDIYWVKVEARI